MSNELVLLEQQLRPLTPHFGEALAGTGLAPEKLIRTILVSMERTPALLECTRQSIIQAAMTAAVLGLEADGATGQFFMLPFKQKAQPVIGYKGYNTLGGRSGFTINGATVREGDPVFDYEQGSSGFIRHRPLLGGGRKRRIIAAWATASRPGHAPIVQILDIDDILFIKSRSPGAKRSDSPWNDEDIGFPAMAEKSAKRRLARSLPMNLMVTAAAMEEAFDERGKHAFIHPDKGLIVDGVAQHIGDPQPGNGPSASSIEQRRFVIRKAKGDIFCDTIEQWRARHESLISTARSVDDLENGRNLNAGEMARISDEYPEYREHVNAVAQMFEKGIREL